MKTLSAFLLFILYAGTITAQEAAVDSNQFNGTWIPVKLVIGGTELPDSTFSNQKLTIEDSSYTFVAESVDKGTVIYNDNKIDLYGKDGPNKGRHMTAIYKFEDGLLTICYNLAGDHYPESFETKGKPMYFLAEFNREK